MKKTEEKKEKKEEKKKRRKRIRKDKHNKTKSFPLGRLYHPVAKQIITDRRVLPTSLGIQKLLLLASHHFEIHSQGQHCLQVSRGLCHLISTQRQMLQLGNDLPGGKDEGYFRKDGPLSLVAGRLQPVTTPPRYKQSGVDAPQESGPQPDLISPLMNKNDLHVDPLQAWAYLYCFCLAVICRKRQFLILPLK